MQKDVKFGAEIMWGEFRSVKIRREILNKMSSLLCHLLGSTAHISPKVEVKLFSCVHFFATPWTVAYQASPSVGFSRQGYRSGVPFPSPGDLPNPGIEPGLLLCRQLVYHLSNSIFSCFFFFFPWSNNWGNPEVSAYMLTWMRTECWTCTGKREAQI